MGHQLRTDSDGTDSEQYNLSTVDFGTARLQMRRDLRFQVRHLGGEISCVVEDLATSNFFQIGKAEYAFLSLLDGKRTLSEAVAESAISLGRDAISDDEAASLAMWLIENRLVSTAESDTFERMQKRVRKLRQSKLAQTANPLMLRVNLGNPDKVITLLHRFTSWVFCWPIALLLVATVASATLVVLQNWGRFCGGLPTIYAPHNWFHLAMTWMVLKSTHELAHAICCKHFGGQVRRTGILFVVLMPLPFVDLTSAWRFHSKYARMLTSAAGMIAEILIASVAVFVWSQLGTNSIVAQHAYHVILTAGLMTVVVNANPLMRFDGYYILSDLLDLPNLASHGQQYFKQLTHRIFFGRSVNEYKLSTSKNLIIKSYGLAAIVWRTLVVTSLTLATANLLEGVGLIMALVAVGLWFVIPLLKLLKFIAVGSPTFRPNRLRFFTATGVLVSLISAFLILVPGPTSITAPAIIDYDPVQIVRAKSNGFVDKILVTPNERVVGNQPLAMLKDDELLSQLAQLEFDIERTKIQSQTSLVREDVATSQIARSNLAALWSRREQLRADVENLVVRASQDGIVLSRDLSILQSKYVARGEDLMVIGDPSRKKAIALFRPEDLNRLRESESNAELRLFGGWSAPVIGRITSIRQKATNDVAHPGFAVAAGGPLAAVDVGGNLRLIEERVEATFSISDLRIDIFPGQNGQVRIQGEARNLGFALQSKIRQWVTERIRLNHGI